jgi:hypothetical protein
MATSFSPKSPLIETVAMEVFNALSSKEKMPSHET